jgi:hypothetical protein
VNCTTTFLLAIDVFHSTDHVVEEIVQVRQKLQGVTVITIQQVRYEWLIMKLLLTSTTIQEESDPNL